MKFLRVNKHSVIFPMGKSCQVFLFCVTLLVMWPSFAETLPGGSSLSTTTAQKMADQKIQEEEAFLTANAEKPGVVTLESGLQYKILTPGTGQQPKSTNAVKVDYEGQLLNGRIFDSSWKRGEPITLSLQQVIAGWQQALVLMKEGAVWMLYIPAHLAYGSRGVPGTICPNEMLVFKVQLHSVVS